jgi:uncharacterized membrane protein SpoIIM required for sporulation
MEGRAVREDETLADARRLAELVRTAELRGARALDGRAVEEFPRLFRAVGDLLAEREARGSPPGATRALRDLLARAHGLLHQPFEVGRASAPRRALEFLLSTSPCAIRAEWRLGLALLGIFYALALAAGLAVRGDLGLAYALFDPAAVEHTVQQLRETPAGEPFRGNFTFGLGESPSTSGFILAHNVGIALLFFASALVPPLFAWILAQNALMVGTYTALAGHWGQAGAISSILWCHGVIELQMIVLAGMAGLVLVRGALMPGPWTRSHALTLESRRAWALLAPTLPLLFLSGLNEGFVSPHAPLGVRIAVAVGTGLALCLWIALGGRTSEDRDDEPSLSGNSAARSPRPS